MRRVNRGFSVHQAAYDFVAHYARNGGPFATVVEIGSRDINGSVRALFTGARYVGLDLYPGPSVDRVGDALDYEPGYPVDQVVCCEVLEHAERWPELIAAAAGWLRPGGHLVITCAGPGRTPHSARDGQRRLDGEYYGNVSVDALAKAIECAGLRPQLCRQVGEDIQAIAQKP